MEKRQKNIDDLFKDELDSYTETPPPPAWEALEKRLDSARPGAAFSYRRLWPLAFLCGVLLLSVPLIKKMSAPSSDNNIIAQDNRQSQANSTNTDKNIANNNNSASNKPTSTDNTQTTASDNNTGNDNPDNNEQSTNTNANNVRKGQKGKQIATNRKTKHTLYNSHPAGKTNSKNEIDEQPEVVYNSHTSNPAPEQEVPGNNVTEGPKDQQTPKNNDVGEKKNPPVNNPPKKPSKPKYNRFELGIKAGYETGFDNDAAKKIVVTPYVQYKISPKFAIMLQPAVKAAQIQNRRIGKINTYYKENSDSNTIAIRDPHDVNLFDGGKMAMWHFTYSQTHDSLVKSNTIGGTYLELEMPVLLKFYLAKTFSVYGGVNISYSNTPGITEHSYSKNNILKIDSSHIQLAAIDNPNAPVAQFHVNDLIKYNGNPYSNYTGPYPSSQEGLLRFGYMVGFSYEYNKRLLFDALVQQGSAKSNVQGGYNINSALSAPYIRFTLGYKLIK
jgi:hypothetical protein